VTTAELLDRYYEATHCHPDVDVFHDRHGLQSACILTVTTDEQADAIASWLAPRIAGKVVVEIGAGIGLLACHMAQYAKKVYAIEMDPAWTSVFVWQMYAKKPANLTFIFGKAEEAPPIAADVALFCTHSGHSMFWMAASRFAPTVIDVYTEILPPGAYTALMEDTLKELRGDPT
jgi:precorrin-6B methylase 2